MSDFNSPEEAYESIAESLNYLSSKGETVIFTPATPKLNAKVSGINGGVVWNAHPRKWEAYKD